MDQFCPLLLYDIIWEHDRLNPVQFQCTLKYSCGMCSESDVSDLSCCFGFHKSFQSTAFTNYLVQLFHTRVMYLIQIYIICTEVSKTCLDICCHCFFCSGHGLCCKHEFVTNPFQPISNILFTDGITSCRINIVDSFLCHRMKKLLCSFLIDLLNRNSSKSHT